MAFLSMRSREKFGSSIIQTGAQHVSSAMKNHSVGTEIALREPKFGKFAQYIDTK